MSKSVDVTTLRRTFSGNGMSVECYTVIPTGPTGPTEPIKIDASGTRMPALILVHEWWGVTPHIEDVARRYAREGFIVIAPDLYDGVTTTDAGEAGRLMAELSLEKGLSYLQVVLAELRTWPTVSAIGVTGFCMGGTFALRLACESKVDAAVPFYGDVPEDTGMIADLSCPLLFIGGEKDAWITTGKMSRLSAALELHSKPGEVRIYSGASHAFFNDTRPEVYSPADAADAWRRVVDFLKSNLVGG